MQSYYLRILKDYMRDHLLCYEKLEGERRIQVAQGFILGPYFWKASDNSFLRLNKKEVAPGRLSV